MHALHTSIGPYVMTDITETGHVLLLQSFGKAIESRRFYSTDR